MVKRRVNDVSSRCAAPIWIGGNHSRKRHGVDLHFNFLASTTPLPYAVAGGDAPVIAAAEVLVAEVLLGEMQLRIVAVPAAAALAVAAVPHSVLGKLEKTENGLNRPCFLQRRGEK